MWQTDGFAEAACHAAVAATSASRFAEDAEIYGSAEFGLLRDRRRAVPGQCADAAEAQPLRAGRPARRRAVTLLGARDGRARLPAERPRGRTDNLLYAYGEVAGAVELVRRGLLNLAAAACRDR